MEIASSIIAARVLAIVLFGICVFRFYLKLRKIFKTLSLVADRIDNKDKMIELNGVVLKLGIDIDYDYPYQIPTLKGTESDSEYDEIEKKFIRTMESYARAKEYFGAYILYAYRINSRRYFSRRISEIHERDDIGYVYKLKVGDPIKVYVDKNDPNYSLLFPANNEKYGRYAVGLFKTCFLELIFTVATGALVAATF